MEKGLRDSNRKIRFQLFLNIHRDMFRIPENINYYSKFIGISTDSLCVIKFLKEVRYGSLYYSQIINRSYNLDFINTYGFFCNAFASRGSAHNFSWAIGTVR